MIPCDWEVCPLNFFADILNGDRGVNYPKDSDFCDVGIPFINAGHLKKCQIDFSCMDYITYEHYKKLGGAKIKKNDILFCLRGSLGKYAYVNFDDAAPASSLCVLRSKKIDPKYLFQLLGFEYIKTQIIDANSGSSQPNLSAKDVGNFNVIFPPTIEEQQRIANVLSDVDTLIANLEKLIAKKKNIKQGAMQQLLTGRKRLPGFAPAKPTYKQTELGMIPADWDVKTFKKVATLINGRAYSQNELLDHGKYRVLRVGNFGTNDSWYYSNLELPEKMYCNKGDLLYCWSCTYGAYIWDDEKAIFHYHIWKIADLKAEKRYLLYILNNDVAQQMNSSNGSTMSHITKEFLENRLFIFPPSITEQTAIANVLSDMDTEIATLETKLAKYRKLKTGMMQQLLTGKIRLV